MRHSFSLRSTAFFWLVLAAPSAFAETPAAPEASPSPAPAKESAAAPAPAPADAPAPAKEPAAPPDAPASSDSPAPASEAAPEGAFAPGEEPNRPPAAGKGVVWGRIADRKTGDPAVEAEIRIGNQKERVYTDYDGYFRLELRPGEYEIEVRYDLYETERVQGVVVTLGGIARLDVSLAQLEGAIQETVIVEQAERQTVAGLALARQKSASSGDAIGRAEIAKTGDSNAAAAARRVVGVNIVGNRFVYVRGLGERYSNSLLSGFPLPSPEPDRAAVPLDVFPASLLDSLTIVKTATPDVPADFAGGSVQIETRSVPEKPLFNITLSAGYDTQSTFKKRLDFVDGSTDFLGFDGGMRALPASVPRDRLLTGGMTPAEQQQLGQDMNTPMAPVVKQSPFNHGFQVVAGNTWTFDKGQKFGALASINYSHSYQRHDDAVVREFMPDQDGTGTIVQRLDYRMDRGIELVRWGAFTKFSYLPSPDHKITLTGLHSQSVDDQTIFYSGNNADVRRDFAGLTNDWSERGMSFGMLSGRHTLRPLAGGQLDWDVALSRAARLQPDRRDYAYSFNSRQRVPGSREPSPAWVFQNDASSGRHFYAEQEELARGGKVDYRQPLVVGGGNELALKVGGFLNLKDRKFAARRFSYGSEGAQTADYICLGENFDMIGCPNQLFTSENIENGSIVLDEWTREGDAYQAILNVVAGYGLIDFDWGKKLRVVAGARLESTDQQLTPTNAATGEALTNFERSVVQQLDVLPSVNLIHAASKQWKGRYSYSRTLARPQLRELAPFNFADYFGGRLVAGNPELEMSTIDNVDTRLEFWPTVTDVLAASVFYKHIQKPIEAVFVFTSDQPQLTYQNSPQANVAGLELEVRKSLGFVTPSLADLAVVTNFTLTYSRVQVPEDQPATSFSRTLVNQAPWLLNVALDYENSHGTAARVSYNVSGPTLVEVGTSGVPDAYQQPLHQLDAVIRQKFLDHWSVGLVAQNLVNSPFLVTLGNSQRPEDVVRRWTTGSTFALSLGYDL